MSSNPAAPSNKSGPTAAMRIYSTLSRTKEPLVPVHPGRIGIYLCGPTVYKPSHIGHMVGPVIFDAIKRYLTYSGYQVTWVVNITDVDDKLIVESRNRNMPMPQLAAEMTADYMRNLDAMGIDTIDHFPKATENIDEIIRLTQRLIDRGYAYASAGDVYFDVGRDPDYGKLSRRTLESVQGEGGEMAERKRSPADFALWKSAKPGEPSWDSPWGKGRPGWHIECSAMSRRILGETFDIHGGGLDLIFPHHENEIAQSECAHAMPQAKYWLHNGLMQAAGEVGKVGGRSDRSQEPAGSDAAAQHAAQQAGKISKSTGAAPFSELLRAASARSDPLLPALDPLPQSDPIQRRTAGRDGPQPRSLLSFLQTVRARRRAKFLQARCSGHANRRRVRAGQRSDAERSRQLANPLSRSDGRRFQHRRRHRHALRFGAIGQQVRRHRTARSRRRSRPPSNRRRCCNLPARFASFPARSDCSASRSKKNRRPTTA